MPRLTRRAWFDRSIIWAGFYLALIPLFAFVYFCLPAHSFYHQTSQLERGVAQDQQKAERAIEECMLAEIKNHPPPLRWMIATIQVRYLAPVPASSDFKFSATFNFERLYGPVAPIEGASKTVATPSVDVTVQDETSSEASTGTRGGPNVYVVTVAAVPPGGTAPGGILPGNLFPFRYEPHGGILRMPVTRDAKRKIDTYLDGMHGFPHELSWEHFDRMLYFSASTLTTAGFGDILPLTVWARSLTTGEAILGIVVIGWFLNALAHEASGPRGP
jgi:hypothetical protein